MNRAVAGRAGRKPIPYRIVVRGEMAGAAVHPPGAIRGACRLRIEDGFSVITRRDNRPARNCTAIPSLVWLGRTRDRDREPDARHDSRKHRE